MRVFQVDDTTALDLEVEVPVEVRLDVEQELIDTQQRVFDAEKKITLGLAKLREEYKEEIQYLMGAETMKQNTERLADLNRRIAAIDRSFPHTKGGEKEMSQLRRSLRKEKHDFYHSLDFDVARAVQVRKKYLARAEEILDRGTEPDAELPPNADKEEPLPTDNPWTWRFPRYDGQFSKVEKIGGSRGCRYQTANASSKTGEINLWSRMDLSGADDSDWSRIVIRADVGFWYRMPAAGMVEVWITYQDINTDYTGRLVDESGCSDASIRQLSRAYLWTSGSGLMFRFATIVDYRRGENEGSWAEPGPTAPGQFYVVNLFSQKSYHAGDWVWVAAGIQDENNFSVDDMSCRSTMVSQWFVHHVRIRSTGAP